MILNDEQLDNILFSMPAPFARELRSHLADLKLQLIQALAQVEIVDRSLGDPGNTSSKAALDAHDAEVHKAGYRSGWDTLAAMIKAHIPEFDSAHVMTSIEARDAEVRDRALLEYFHALFPEGGHADYKDVSACVEEFISETEKYSRRVVLRNLAEALKKVCPEVIPQIISAANPEEEFIAFLRGSK